MDARYESAKRVALGLEKEQAASAGEDLWSISLGDGFSGGFSLAAEMPFQNFEKGFEPPDELTAQRAGLMLYEDEFRQDEAAAQKRLARLEEALRKGDADAVGRIAGEAPLSGWLSLVFLDGEKLRTELVPAIESAAPACRSALKEGIERALSELVDFKELLETLRDRC